MKACHDRHRLNARLAGKDAERQARWFRKRYEDPEFRAKELARYRQRDQRPDVRLARQLGVSSDVARVILEAAA